MAKEFRFRITSAIEGNAKKLTTECTEDTEKVRGLRKAGPSASFPAVTSVGMTIFLELKSLPFDSLLPKT
jgi:hypothetical protein